MRVWIAFLLVACSGSPPPFYDPSLFDGGPRDSAPSPATPATPSASGEVYVFGGLQGDRCRQAVLRVGETDVGVGFPCGTSSLQRLRSGGILYWDSVSHVARRMRRDSWDGVDYPEHTYVNDEIQSVPDACRNVSGTSVATRFLVEPSSEDLLYFCPCDGACSGWFRESGREYPLPFSTTTLFPGRGGLALAGGAEGIMLVRGDTVLAGPVPGTILAVEAVTAGFEVALGGAAPVSLWTVSTTGEIQKVGDFGILSGDRPSSCVLQGRVLTCARDAPLVVLRSAVGESSEVVFDEAEAAVGFANRISVF